MPAPAGKALGGSGKEVATAQQESWTQPQFEWRSMIFVGTSRAPNLG